MKEFSRNSFPSSFWWRTAHTHTHTDCILLSVDHLSHEFTPALPVQVQVHWVNSSSPISISPTIRNLIPSQQCSYLFVQFHKTHSVLRELLTNTTVDLFIVPLSLSGGCKVQMLRSRVLWDGPSPWRSGPAVKLVYRPTHLFLFVYPFKWMGSGITHLC